jgi:hypothetical protein
MQVRDERHRRRRGEDAFGLSNDGLGAGRQAHRAVVSLRFDRAKDAVFD